MRYIETHSYIKFIAPSNNFIWKYKNILKVNLTSQEIAIGKTDIKFDIDNHRKESLLNGWDDIDLTLKHEEKISSYEINNPNSCWIDIER